MEKLQTVQNSLTILHINNFRKTSPNNNWFTNGNHASCNLQWHSKIYFHQICDMSYLAKAVRHHKKDCTEYSSSTDSFRTSRISAIISFMCSLQKCDSVECTTKQPGFVSTFYLSAYKPRYAGNQNIK